VSFSVITLPVSLLTVPAKIGLPAADPRARQRAHHSQGALHRGGRAQSVEQSLARFGHRPRARDVARGRCGLHFAAAENPDCVIAACGLSAIDAAARVLYGAAAAGSQV
jgi:hypothetical protein